MKRHFKEFKLIIYLRKDQIKLAFKGICNKIMIRYLNKLKRKGRKLFRRSFRRIRINLIIYNNKEILIIINHQLLRCKD